MRDDDRRKVQGTRLVVRRSKMLDLAISPVVKVRQEIMSLWNRMFSDSSSLLKICHDSDGEVILCVHQSDATLGQVHSRAI